MFPSVPVCRSSFSRRPAVRLVACVAVALTILGPDTAAAQGGWLGGIKSKVAETVGKKVAEHGAKAESTVVNTTGSAADSALAKGNRGLGATMDKASALTNAGLNAVENGAIDLFAGRTTTPDQFLADLNAGRVTLRDVEFGGAEGSDLKPSSEPVMRKLATALAKTTGAFLIEAHTNLVGDAAIEQALSDRRAVAMKARLVALGVPTDRLVPMGFGATRLVPGTNAASNSARIEVAKMQ